MIRDYSKILQLCLLSSFILVIILYFINGIKEENPLMQNSIQMNYLNLNNNLQITKTGYIKIFITSFISSVMAIIILNNITKDIDLMKANVSTILPN